MVRKKKSSLDVAISDLVDENVSEINNKWGLKVKAQKYVYGQHLNILYQDFLRLNPGKKDSISLYYKCKPFYISQANTWKMEASLCAKCLNPHALYNCLRKHIDNLPLSLTDYLTENFECSEHKDINYPKIQCIKGNCKNGCKITYERCKHYNWKERVSYYIFVGVT